MKSWKLAEAKNRLCEVADLAASRGPQKITRANKETVVLIALKDLEKMTPGAVDEFFAQAPDGEELAQVLKHLKP